MLLMDSSDGRVRLFRSSEQLLQRILMMIHFSVNHLLFNTFSAFQYIKSFPTCCLFCSHHPQIDCHIVAFVARPSNKLNLLFAEHHLFVHQLVLYCFKHRMAGQSSLGK